jgi:hypothetical protein
MLTYHLMHLKAIVLWNVIKSHEKNSFMLNESWQSTKQVLIYRHQVKKKSLAVDLVYQFDRVKDEIISLVFDDAMIVTTIIVSKKLITITIKLQRKMNERAALVSQIAEQVHALKALHACEKRSCSNFNRYCWNNLDNDQHYSLTSHHFVTWNSTLNNETREVDFQNLSMIIRENLMSRKDRKKVESSVKQKSQKNFSHSIYQHFSYQSLSYQFFSYHQQFAYASQFSHFSSSSSLLRLSFVFSRHSSSHSRIRHSRLSLARLSSSIEDENLKNYINWHIEINSRQHDAFMKVFRELTNSDYDLMIIQTLKEMNYRLFWIDMNILSNIEIQLTKNISKFEREMRIRQQMLSSLDQQSFFFCSQQFLSRSQQFFFRSQQFFSRSQQFSSRSQQFLLSRSRYLLSSLMITQIESRETRKIRRMNDSREMKNINDEMKMIEKTNDEKQCKNNSDDISIDDEN